MAKTVVNDFYKKEELEIAKFCKAFAHPARLAILRLLMNSNGCFVGEIVNKLPISQSSVSQHLKELKKIGIINSQYTPPKIKYSFNFETFNYFKHYQTEYFRNGIYQENSFDQ